MSEKYAILIDGGFIKKKLKQSNQHFPTIDEISGEIDRIKTHDSLNGMKLLRVYFYDASPASTTLVNPVDGATCDLSAHPDYQRNISLHQQIEMLSDAAFREGETSVHGWSLGSAAMKDISKNGARPIAARDFVPNIEQKGVDLRIGLDIARLSTRRLVDVIVVVTGDSDMIPAFKFARREGLRIYLDHMGHGVKRDLRAHTDMIF